MSRAAPLAPASSKDVGLYVHFPYCSTKCPYCDFNVVATRHDDEAYADAILAELAARGPELAGGRPFSTLYLGGGTPSEWAPEAVARVITEARAAFGLIEGAEVTLEANPGPLTDERIDAFAAGGVNRLSIGAQSLLDPELRLLGRSHSAEGVARTIRAGRAAGLRLSVDLIYGLPGQTVDDVSRSVDGVLALGVEHVSAYTLTVEPRTLFSKRTRQGRLPVVDEDAQAALIEHLTARLEAAGLPRYEISSYAAPGDEAVHNSIYWAGGAYLGLGAGAHSYRPAPGGLAPAVRRENVRRPREYLARAKAGEFPASFEEILDLDTALKDRLLVGLRTRFGLDLDALAGEAGLEGSLQAALGPAIEALTLEGLVAWDPSGRLVRPTARGFLFGDLIARRLLSAVDTLP